MPFNLDAFQDGTNVGNCAEDTRYPKHQTPSVFNLQSQQYLPRGFLYRCLRIKETNYSAPWFAVILGTCGSSLKFKQTPLTHAKNRNIKEFAFTVDCRVAQTCF